MNNKKSIKYLLRKISTIVLVFTLILGILSTGFGIGIVAFGKQKANKEQAEVQQGTNAQNQPVEETYENPTAGKGDATNELSVKDDVIVFTQRQAQEINSAIYSVERENNGYGKNIILNMHGENVAGFNDIRRGSIVYLQGDKNSPLGESRFMKVESVSTYNGETTVKTSEPYFEDVFQSMDMCTSDMLTEDNFVDAYYMDGVTSSFGEFDETTLDLTQSGVIETPQVGNPDMNTEKPEISNMANQYQTNGDDLIITLDIDLTDLFEKDDDDDEEEKPDAEEEEDDDDAVESNFSITGQIGIRDLTAYMVCDMPSLGNFEELFIGASGQFFTDVHFNCGVEAGFGMDPAEKEWKYLTVSGLNEKRFPIAVFQFHGLTPVYITNGAFEATKESVIPSLYVIVYADWEGRISINLSAGFEYAHSFNSGLSVYKGGNFGLSFENYPYTKAYDVEDEDGFTWDVTLALEAETDITLLGCSVVFYVAGINIGELSIARLGFEAKAHVEATANSREGLKKCDSSTTEFYIRAYLKMIEVKLKLTLDGEGILDALDLDLDFQFSLLDITLFEKGVRPDKYIPEVPVSSMEVPTEFDSVITIVFDVSGSMSSSIDTGESKLRAAQNASKTILNSTKAFAEKYPDEKYGIGIVRFSDYGETVSVPHIDYKYLDDCIETLYTTGGTNIYAGVDVAVGQLDAIESPNKIIILMTDGQGSGSAEDVAGLATGKDIKIYTVGFGSDVNESYLQTIASLSGGEYRFADTSNMMGVIGSFLYAQQASTSEVVAEFEDSVAEGETSKPQDFVVKDKNGDLRVTTAWPGSFLDTILIDPTGRVVDENYPGTTIDETQIPSIITVENPIHGTWSVQVKGVETSYDKEPFYTIVSFKETEASAVNEKMNTWEEVSAYCIPIGAYVTLISSLLLVCVGKKKKDDDI